MDVPMPEPPPPPPGYKPPATPTPQHSPQYQGSFPTQYPNFINSSPPTYHPPSQHPSNPFAPLSDHANTQQRRPQYEDHDTDWGGPTLTFPHNVLARLQNEHQNRQNQQIHQEQSMPSPTYGQPQFIPPMQQRGPPNQGTVIFRHGADVLGSKVPTDSFGLIGEILLCPCKVTLAILLALIRRDER